MKIEMFHSAGFLKNDTFVPKTSGLHQIHLAAAWEPHHILFCYQDFLSKKTAKAMLLFLFQFLSQEAGSDIKLLLERFFRTLYEMRNQSQIRILQKFRFLLASSKPLRILPNQ